MEEHQDSELSQVEYSGEWKGEQIIENVLENIEQQLQNFNYFEINEDDEDDEEQFYSDYTSEQEPSTGIFLPLGDRNGFDLHKVVTSDREDQWSPADDEEEDYITHNNPLERNQSRSIPQNGGRRSRDSNTAKYNTARDPHHWGEVNRVASPAPNEGPNDNNFFLPPGITDANEDDDQLFDVQTTSHHNSPKHVNNHVHASLSDGAEVVGMSWSDKPHYLSDSRTISSTWSFDSFHNVPHFTKRYMAARVTQNGSVSEPEGGTGFYSSDYESVNYGAHSDWEVHTHQPPRQEEEHQHPPVIKPSSSTGESQSPPKPGMPPRAYSEPGGLVYTLNPRTHIPKGMPGVPVLDGEDLEAQVTPPQYIPAAPTSSGITYYPPSTVPNGGYSRSPITNPGLLNLPKTYTRSSPTSSPHNSPRVHYNSSSSAGSPPPSPTSPHRKYQQQPQYRPRAASTSGSTMIYVPTSSIANGQVSQFISSVYPPLFHNNSSTTSSLNLPQSNFGYWPAHPRSPKWQYHSSSSYVASRPTSSSHHHRRREDEKKKGMWKVKVKPTDATASSASSSTSVSTTSSSSSTSATLSSSASAPAVSSTASASSPSSSTPVATTVRRSTFSSLSPPFEPSGLKTVPSLKKELFKEQVNSVTKEGQLTKQASKEKLLQDVNKEVEELKLKRNSSSPASLPSPLEVEKEATPNKEQESLQKLDEPKQKEEKSRDSKIFIQETQVNAQPTVPKKKRQSSPAIVTLAKEEETKPTTTSPSIDIPAKVEVNRKEVKVDEPSPNVVKEERQEVIVDTPSEREIGNSGSIPKDLSETITTSKSEDNSSYKEELNVENMQDKSFVRGRSYSMGSERNESPRLTNSPSNELLKSRSEQGDEFESKLTERKSARKKQEPVQVGKTLTRKNSDVSTTKGKKKKTKQESPSKQQSSSTPFQTSKDKEADKSPMKAIESDSDGERVSSSTDSEDETVSIQPKKKRKSLSSILLYVKVSFPQPSPWFILYFAIFTILYGVFLFPFFNSNLPGITSVNSWIPIVCGYFVLLWVQVKCAMYIFPDELDERGDKKLRARLAQKRRILTAQSKM